MNDETTKKMRLPDFLKAPPLELFLAEGQAFGARRVHTIGLRSAKAAESDREVVAEEMAWHPLGVLVRVKVRRESNGKTEDLDEVFVVPAAACVRIVVGRE